MASARLRVYPSLHVRRPRGKRDLSRAPKRLVRNTLTASSSAPIERLRASRAVRCRRHEGERMLRQFWRDICHFKRRNSRPQCHRRQRQPARSAYRGHGGGLLHTFWDGLEVIFGVAKDSVYWNRFTSLNVIATNSLMPSPGLLLPTSIIKESLVHSTNRYRMCSRLWSNIGV